jgi:hypothetical protein
LQKKRIYESNLTLKGMATQPVKLKLEARWSGIAVQGENLKI